MAEILNVSIQEAVRPQKGKRKHVLSTYEAITRSARTAASGPATPRGGKRSWDCPVVEDPASLPPPHRVGGLSNSIQQTRAVPALDQVESSGCFHSEGERKWGSGWRDHLSFGLIVFLRCQMSSFPSGLKILNILSLAQHSGCSHNHPYFNTKIKHCVP